MWALAKVLDAFGSLVRLHKGSRTRKLSYRLDAVMARRRGTVCFSKIILRHAAQVLLREMQLLHIDIKISNAFVSSQVKAGSRTPVITFANRRKVHTQMHLSASSEAVYCTQKRISRIKAQKLAHGLRVYDGRILHYRYKFYQIGQQ